MSLHLEFEPHSWYKGFAIKKDVHPHFSSMIDWSAYYEDGMYTYSVIELYGDTLKELKQKITAYHKRLADRDAENRKRLGEK